LLIERDELTSGSTWHAAGNCPNFSTSWNVLKFQRHSTKLYAKLGDEVDYPMNYHVTGSIRLAHTKARMEEYAHVRGMARAQGLEFELLSPADIKKRYPFIELHDLEGGLWDPFDGDIDPSQLTQAYAKGARDMGAEIARFTRVTGLERTKAGEWLVKTDKGDVTCEFVVNAAGYRAGEIMSMVGQYMPIVSMSHQYLVTEPVPAGRREESCRCCAIPIPATICGRSAAVCCSAPMSGRRRPIGSTAFPRSSPMSSIPTIWSASKPTSTTPSSACRSSAPSACRR
jgi:dimethylglycine dehydrogenase